MLGEEKVKLNLSLAYKIGVLYLKLMASASTVADLTGVPVSSVKRYLNMLGTRTDDYLRLLPELGDKECLLRLQKKIDEQKEQSIIENKWNVAEAPLNIFQDEVVEIKELYNQIKPLSDEDIRRNIKDLQIDGLSMRKIAAATGVSLRRIHRILSTEGDKAK